MNKVVKFLIYLFLSITAIIYLAPLVWVFFVSFKTNKEIFTDPFGLPKSFFIDNYTFAWTAGKLGIAMSNSLFVCVITLILSLFLGSTVSFAIGRMRWKISGLVLVYFMTGMMIPVHCVLIPLFIQFSSWKLTNSLIGLIIPYVTFSLPITIYIMVGFFEGIPNELFEAAVIDGCSIPRMFITVALPMAKTGFMVTGLMSFISNWNELLLAMVFISKETFKTLPVSLTKFVGPYHTNYTQMFAGIMIAVIPTIIVYCIFANQIVEGLTAGAVKG